MASDVGLRAGFARHGRALMSIIVFQTLLIGWLSLWAVEDYLNNAYVRAYVDLSIQTQGWLLGVLAFTGVLGSVMALVVRRNRHASMSVELADTGTMASISTPVSTHTPAVSTKPSVELHPAVAALKAELSERRMSLGLESVASGPERNAAPVANFEHQKVMSRTQSPLVVQSPMMGPRPQPTVPGTIPASVIRPTPPNASRPIPPTVIRPMMPSRGSFPLPQTAPVLKVEPGHSPVAAEPRPDSAPATSREQPTVVTGILPAQQKKPDPESPAGQNASQQ